MSNSANSITIRVAQAQDVETLHDALEELSRDLDDDHVATHLDLLKFGYGDYPSFTALLAEDAREVVGACVFSPVFSTTRGGAGAYVSDLWVAQSHRGDGLGKRLLAETGKAAEELWGASYLKLSVYHSNFDARAAYLKLGFEAQGDEMAMILAPDEFKIIRQLA